MLLQKCLLPVQLSFTILLAAAVFTAGRKSPPLDSTAANSSLTGHHLLML